MKPDSYTLEFSYIGKERSDGTFRVYLRYYQLRKSKKVINYIPTDYYLLKSEILRLKAGTLKAGDIVENLISFRKAVKEAIDWFCSMTYNYPTIDQVNNAVRKRKEENSTGAGSYRIRYFEYLRLSNSETSIRTYSHQLQVYINYLNKGARLNRSDEVDYTLRPNAVQEYHEYLIRSGSKSSKYIKFLVHQAIQFTNFIRENRNLPKVEYKKHYSLIADSVKSEKSIELSKDELKSLIGFDIDNNVKRSDTKRNLIWVQDIIKLNITIGLRISDILSIEKIRLRINCNIF